MHALSCAFLCACACECARVRACACAFVAVVVSPHPYLVRLPSNSVSFRFPPFRFVLFSSFPDHNSRLNSGLSDHFFPALIPLSIYHVRLSVRLSLCQLVCLPCLSCGLPKRFFLGIGNGSSYIKMGIRTIKELYRNINHNT